MKIIYAIATLAATIIGVGFFALPYLTLQLGFWNILLFFLILGILVALIHVFYGEICLKSPDYQRLPGIAKIYLGNYAEKIAYTSSIFGIIGALLAYLIVGGKFLAELVAPGSNILFFILFYLFLGSLFIFFDIKYIEKVQFLGLILFFVILLFFYFFVKDHINLENLFLNQGLKKGISFSLLFLVYGVILFSLWGASLVPETEELLKDKKSKLSLVIVASILISILVYLFFIYLILGITGEQTTEDALSGLNKFLTGSFGNVALKLMLIFGFLTTFTSFITLGLTLKKILWYDLGFSKNFSWFITSFVPLLLYLLGFTKFISVISLVGSLMLGIDGILILLMYQKIRPERKYLVYPLMLILILGVISAVIYP